MKTTFLFPGQGSQYENMLHELVNVPEIDSKEIFEVLDKNNLSIDKLDTKEDLLHTENVQLCILISGVATAKSIIKKGITPDYVAGNSIGAFSAAVISKCLSFEDAVYLVKIRGMLMENAYPQGYGMLACIGFSLSRLENEVHAFNQKYLEKDKIYIANINTPTQIILAGSINSLKEINNILESKGLQNAKFLKMNVPSHCELLTAEAEKLAKEVSKIEIKTPEVPYLSNITGRVIRNSEGIQKDLGTNIAYSVKWFDGMQLLYELGVRFFLEMFPSGTLCKMISEEFSNTETLGIDLKNWKTITYRYNSLYNQKKE